MVDFASSRLLHRTSRFSIAFVDIRGLVNVGCAGDLASRSTPGLASRSPVARQLDLDEDSQGVSDVGRKAFERRRSAALPRTRLLRSRVTLRIGARLWP